MAHNGDGGNKQIEASREQITENGVAEKIVQNGVPVQDTNEEAKSVVGVVVVGAGIAGRVRIRDLKNREFNDGRFRLVGFVSRRKLEIDGATQVSEDDALSRPDVQAIIVCTEPAVHESLIRRALHAGKHVLVEFPVVPSTTTTTELFDLAKEKGLTLHEENIALLTPGFAEFKEKLSKADKKVAKGEIKLIGSYNGWTEDFENSGGPFCVNISLIQTLYELFGSDLQATGGTLERNDKGFTAVAKLSSAACRKLTLTVRRTKERSKRDKIFLFEFEDGAVLLDKPDAPPPKQEGNEPSKKMGLFMKDFMVFLRKVKGEEENIKDVERTISCMEIADKIHQYMGLKTSLDQQ